MFWVLFFYKYSILKCTWLFIPPPRKHLIRQTRQSLMCFLLQITLLFVQTSKRLLTPKNYCLLHTYICAYIDEKVILKSNGSKAPPSAGPRARANTRSSSALCRPCPDTDTSPGELLTGITGNQNSSARHRDYKIIITKVTEQQIRKPA